MEPVFFSSKGRSGSSSAAESAAPVPPRQICSMPGEDVEAAAAAVAGAAVYLTLALPASGDARAGSPSGGGALPLSLWTAFA